MLTSSAGTAVANNVATVTLTANVRDANNQSVINQRVTLSSSNAGGNDKFSATTGTTSPAGQFTATLRSNRAEAKTLTLTAGAVSVQTSVTFLPGSPNASVSQLALSANAVPATGFYPIALTGTVADVFGNPVGNVQVSFVSPGTSVRLPVAPRVTDANGRVTAAASSQVVQNTSLSLSFAGGNVVQGVSFVTPVATSPVTTSFSVSPNQALRADGSVQAVATFLAKDASGNPLGYRPVSLQSPAKTLTFTPALGATDANGTFVANVTSRISGPATVWARAGNALLSQRVGYLPKANTCRQPQKMAGVFPSYSLAAGTNPQEVIAADVNGDGNVDLVFNSERFVGVALNRGDGTFGSTVYYPSGYSAYQLQVVDLNGDGNVDILRTSHDTNQTFYFLGQGGGKFGNGQALALENAAQGV